MNFISAAAAAGQDAALLLGSGIFGGLAIGTSAWMQGRAAAAASDAYAETGKGTANYFIFLGIFDTAALFTLVFLLLLLQ